MINDNKISLMVKGRFALFSDPLTRVGGEKMSYHIPTYQAMKGILESIYWKPTFLWHVDRVRVMQPIRTQSKGIRPIRYGGGNDLSIYTYLHDVAYQVDAHFVWNPQRVDLVSDRNEGKHYQIAKRMVARGGRRDVFLGTRECQAYVEPCEFGSGSGAYDEVDQLAFGVMFHSFAYPDESGIEMLKVRFWRAEMNYGIIEFPKPEQCGMVRDIKAMSAKTFALGKNCSSVDELMREEGDL